MQKPLPSPGSGDFMTISAVGKADVYGNVRDYESVDAGVGNERL
jgi:hypothetical protein